MDLHQLWFLTFFYHTRRVQVVQRIIMFYGMKTTSQQMEFSLWQTISVIHMLDVHALYPLVSLFNVIKYCFGFRLPAITLFLYYVCFYWGSILHLKKQKLMDLLVLLCSPSSILCTFSSFSCTILHGARPTGNWLYHGWSWFEDNTGSRRLRCQAIAGLEGKCEESNVLLLISEAVWKCMDGTCSKHHPSNSYLYISDSSTMFLIVDPWL